MKMQGIILRMNIQTFTIIVNVSFSVRPNTEYSAEYSAKIGRTFGTEYSAKRAEYRISKIGKNLRKFGVFHAIF